MIQQFELIPDEIRIRKMTSLQGLKECDGIDFLALETQRDERYLVGYAVSERFIKQALRLRYEVFNLELGEGLASSPELGLDRDKFDGQMTHLALLDAKTSRVVGTYRLQTIEHALANKGIYCQREFDLSELELYFECAVECGRACIAPEHRSLISLRLLWSGIAHYLKMHAKTRLFGCCSFKSSDPDDGWRALREIRRQKRLDSNLFLPSRPEFSCGNAAREFDSSLTGATPLPTLLKAYLRQGARIISEPAIDREFGTVDFLMMIHFNRVDF